MPKPETKFWINFKFSLDKIIIKLKFNTKYNIFKLIYGSSASNEYDLQAIEAIGEFWISSIANRRDFDISKLKYKIPNSFLSSQPKPAVLQQSLENIMPFQLEGPEACHLLPSVETILGDDILVMSKLAKLIDTLPSSTLNIKISDRPLTPIDSKHFYFEKFSNSVAKPNPCFWGVSKFSKL